ncbi:MAG TPA: ABC transporter ATP-binding protein [Candidatus Udaeobacter sp.]|nr:ABC transporter ATP-binding protein [Candidatus Udaeobacter sp.]
MVAMIDIGGLVFDYPGLRALDHVSFALEAETITALVGPNGAGKTTLLRCIAGLDAPFAGTVNVAGVDVLREPRASHRMMGFLPDSYGLYDELSVRQCLLHCAATLGLARAEQAAAAESAAGRLAIADRMDQKTGTLSRGLRQRLAIAETIVHRPRVLLLDEPASGLDPEARVGLAETLRRLREEGMTVIVSSHILSELEDYSTHMLVLRDGRLVDQRDLAGPVAGSAGALRLRLVRPDERLEPLLKAEPDVSALILDGLNAHFRFRGDETARAALLRRILDAGVAVAEFAAEREGLQAAYMSGIPPKAVAN